MSLTAIAAETKAHSGKDVKIETIEFGFNNPADVKPAYDNAVAAGAARDTYYGYKEATLDKKEGITTHVAMGSDSPDQPKTVSFTKTGNGKDTPVFSEAELGGIIGQLRAFGVTDSDKLTPEMLAGQLRASESNLKPERAGSALLTGKSSTSIGGRG